MGIYECLCVHQTDVFVGNGPTYLHIIPVFGSVGNMSLACTDVIGNVLNPERCQAETVWS